MDNTWVRGVGTFVAGVLAVSGIAGIPEDLTTWQTWTNALSVLAPWWAFLGLSAVIFAIIWGPVLVATIKRGRDTVRAKGLTSERQKSPDTETEFKVLQAELSKLQEERDDLVQRVAELEAALAGKGAEVDRERGDKETLQKENVNLSLALQNREDFLVETYWSLRYGHDRPIIPNLPLHEIEAERARTQELRPVLVKAAGQCELLLKSLLGEVGARHDATGLRWLADFVNDRVLERVKAARQSLENALNNPEDVRYSLIGFCWNYYEAKKWLIRLIGLLEQPSRVAPAYENWRDADKEFRSELERVLARNSFKAVRERVDHLVAQDAPPFTDLVVSAS
jgi:hypothetical protein